MAPGDGRVLATATALLPELLPRLRGEFERRALPPAPPAVAAAAAAGAAAGGRGGSASRWDALVGVQRLGSFAGLLGARPSSDSGGAAPRSPLRGGLPREAPRPLSNAPASSSGAVGVRRADGSDEDDGTKP